MQRQSILAIVQIGLFAAVLAVLSQISIPLPSGVPVTLQTFAVALSSYTLGWKRGTISVAVYLALGAVGIPVFANFTGGIAKLAGITGGYLWGFLPMALLCGLAMLIWQKKHSVKNGVLCVLLSIAGLAACHVPGVVQFALISGATPLTAFLTASLPYLLKDGISMVLAFSLALAIQRATRMVAANH